MKDINVRPEAVRMPGKTLEDTGVDDNFWGTKSQATKAKLDQEDYIKLRCPHTAQ